MTAYESITIMLMFGAFLTTLILGTLSLIVAIIELSKNNNTKSKKVNIKFRKSRHLSI